MSDIFCSRCGVENSGDSEFCKHCGTPLVAPPPIPTAAETAPPEWQPPASSAPPAQGYPPPPANALPPGGYPVNPGAGKAIGTKTQWARGLAIASFFLLWFYPIASPIALAAAAFMVKLDLDDFAAGRAPELDQNRTKRILLFLLIAIALAAVLAFMHPGGLGPHHS